MRILRDNGLTIVLLGLFAGSIIGQWIAGWNVEMEDARRHGQAVLSLGAYTVSPQFLSSVFENWESEFLQMPRPWRLGAGALDLAYLGLLHQPQSSIVLCGSD